MDVLYRIERAFKVRIDQVEELFSSPDDLTAGKLHAFILSRLRQPERPRCLGIPVFFRFRAALRGVVGTSPDSVRPASSLDEVIPLHARRRNWRQMRTYLDLPLPPLRRPSWMVGALHLSSVLVWLVSGLMLLVNGWQELDVALLGLVLGTGLKYVAAYSLTFPYAVCFPESCRTVKELLKKLIRENFALLAEREQTWHAHDVWLTLRDVLVESLGVPPERVTPQAHLIYDLEMV
jgi:hypothetical protein